MSALAVAAGPDDRELDDLDLVAAVRAGDDRAFEALFLRYQPRIAAYVGGMVRDHGRAEDITQEVFMAALRRLRTDDEREILFRPWIYEIAKNKCIDAYRRGRNTTEVSFDADGQIGATDQGRLAAPGATPDATVEGKVAFDNLRGAFGGLSPVHHEILVMREFEGLSYREIGDRLGMSRTAVESTLFRARKRLGEEYDELVSGRRCLRVQRIVDESDGRASGLRDQRRVARHLAHCQPCRRYAHLAGADLGALRPPSVAARVAAFLPLPAFLRRRFGSGEEAGHVLSQQAARPAAQWSAHLAGSVDPGTVSTWAKAAATAATVALASVGGAAIEHRTTAAAAPAATSAEDAASARSGASRPDDPAGASPAGASPAADSAGTAAPSASPDGPPAASGSPSAPGSPGDADAAIDPAVTATATDLPHSPSGPAGALEPIAGTTDTAAPSALDVGGALVRPTGASADAPKGSTPGRVLAPAWPLTAAAPLSGDGIVPIVGSDAPRGSGKDAPRGSGKAPAPAGGDSAAPTPGRSADAPRREGVPAKDAAADAHRPAHAAEPASAKAGSPPGGGRGTGSSRAPEVRAPTAAAPSLGG
jgi:RNA polymerase sigma factor (sigma-70 family)